VREEVEEVKEVEEVEEIEDVEEVEEVEDIEDRTYAHRAMCCAVFFPTLPLLP
jgi:hypothetical protein